MNIPITTEQKTRFDNVKTVDLLYGSRLFGVNRPDSDRDIISLYDYSDVFSEKHYLPNIHSFKYEDKEKNEDRIYMTYEQFWKAFYDGDGTMYADIVLFGNLVDRATAMKLCRTYKVIKGYCGTAKRDLNGQKDIRVIKRCAKNLYIANKLLENERPMITDIEMIYDDNDHDVYGLLNYESEIREAANHLFNANELKNYYIPITDDDLLNVMLHGNNLKEYVFKR